MGGKEATRVGGESMRNTQIDSLHSSVEHFFFNNNILMDFIEGISPLLIQRIQQLQASGLSKQMFQYDSGEVKQYKLPSQDNLVLMFEDKHNPSTQSPVSNITNIELNSVISLPRIYDTFTKISEAIHNNPGGQINIAGWSKKGLEAELVKAVVGNDPLKQVLSNLNNVKKEDIQKVIRDSVQDEVKQAKQPQREKGKSEPKGIFDKVTNWMENQAVDYVDRKLNEYRNGGLIDKYDKLKDEYGGYYTKLTSQQNMQLLGAVLPTLRKKMQGVNQKLSVLDHKIRHAGIREIAKDIQDLKIPSLDEAKQFFGDLNIQEELNTAFVNIKNYKPTQNHIKLVGNELQKYIPDNEYAKQGYRIAVDIFAKVVTSDKSIHEILKDKCSFTAQGLKHFLHFCLPKILPEEVYNSIKQRNIIETVMKNGEEFLRIWSSRGVLTKMDCAKLTNLGAGIANLIVSCLPVPEEVKQIFALGSSVAALACAVSAGPIFPILMGLLGVFSNLIKLKMCWNSKKSERNENQGQSKGSGTEKAKNGLPTVTNVSKDNSKEYYQGYDPNDSKEEQYKKFVRNYAKKLFGKNTIMSAEEIEMQELKEQQKHRDSIKENPENETEGFFKFKRQGVSSILPSVFQGNSAKEQRQKKKEKLDKESFDLDFWISDFTKNIHQGEKEMKQVERVFQKTEDRSELQVEKHPPISANTKLKKKITIIEMADELPKNQYDSEQIHHIEVVSTGTYFSKEKLEEMDSKRHQKVMKHRKGVDQILTGNNRKEGEAKKGKQSLVMFKNLNMNKESGTVTEGKEGAKNVLVPDKEFGEEGNETPELIREKFNGSIKKAVLNPKIKSNFTVNTFDFFNSMQVDSVTSVNLALASELMFLTDNQMEVLFYKKYTQNSLLGHQRVEESIEKEQENNRKKAGQAHLSYDQLRYKLLGEREEYTQYITGGTYQIVSQDLLPVDTEKQYSFSGEFKVRHNMRLMVGFICYNSQKRLIPGYEVHRKGDYVTFKSYNKAEKLISVEGDLGGWNTFPKNKKLKERLLGIYTDGDTDKNPSFTIICENDPNLESEEDTGFVSVDPKNSTIRLSKYSHRSLLNHSSSLKPNITKLANQIYDSDLSSLICVDIKNIEPSEDFREVAFHVEGEGRGHAHVWNPKSSFKCSFWPETAYVQIAIYTNWFDNPKRVDKGELIWRNIHFAQI